MWQLLPIAAAIWFSGTGDILSFPAYPLLRGLSNHGLLGLQSQLEWRTLTGGSHSYVQAMELGLGDCVHTGTPVVRIERGEHEVGLCFADHGRDTFDAVILATHADEALALLADPSDGERELLGTWRYTNHEAVLHTDLRLLPRRRATRAPRSCWLSDCKRPAERVSVSYYLNRLQSLDATEPYIVTLNPVQPPAAGRVVHRVWMRRPVYTSGSLAAQKALAGLQGVRRTYYCGAYLGWGCHEDGLVSALQVAEQLGVRRW